MHNNTTIDCIDNTKQQTICQLTSRHSNEDERILHRMAWSANRHGYESIVVGMHGRNAMYGGIKLWALANSERSSIYYRLMGLFQLMRLSISCNFNIYQLHDPDMLLMGIILKLFGKRIIYDIHEDYETSVKDRLRTTPWLARICSKLWWWFERNASRIFDGIVVTDRHLAGKFSFKQPVILGNYPSLDFTEPADTSFEKTFNIIYVGGVNKDRGVGKVIEALKLLQHEDIRFHIIGECSDYTLQAQILSDNRVIHIGWVPWRELHRYYTKTHLGVALYQPLSGFQYYPGENSVKVNEYMAVGIPVLCSDFPGLKSFVEEHHYGLTVKPDDPHAIAEKIQYLYEHPEFCNELGQNGRQAFEREYNWEKHESKLIDLYKLILNGKTLNGPRKNI